MFSVGEFAHLGRVSVRMLRHYDALGLLRPARVDAASGYRFYRASQLSRLNRIVALKDLGFTLGEVGSILDEELGVAELQGMLRLRRAELESDVAAQRERLARVEARLAIIESEGAVPVDEVVLKRIPPVRVAELDAMAASFAPEDVGPVIGPLFDELLRRLHEAGVPLTGPTIAYYEIGADGTRIHAAAPVAAAVPAGLNEVELPAVDAATVVHRGPLDRADASEQLLARWVEASGYRAVGFREVYLECPPDREQWVTELQEPVVREQAVREQAARE